MAPLNGSFAALRTTGFNVLGPQRGMDLPAAGRAARAGRCARHRLQPALRDQQRDDGVGAVGVDGLQQPAIPPSRATASAAKATPVGPAETFRASLSTGKLCGRRSLYVIL